MYNVTSMSQIHATDVNGEGCGRRCPQDGTSGLHGGGEASFQVFSLVPCSINPTLDNSYTPEVGQYDVTAQGQRGVGSLPCTRQKEKASQSAPHGGQQQLKEKIFYF
jgi:hypothetical protein